MILPPPKLEDLPAGSTVAAGRGTSTILPDFDFETFSPAGFVWDSTLNKWCTLPNASKKGIEAVGAAKYTEHPDAEVLSLAYDLKDGKGRRLWVPEYIHHTSLKNYPDDLLEYIENGGLIEAWNVAFEYWVWVNICTPKYCFPPLKKSQLRCAAAKSRAFALPSSLAKAGDVMGIIAKKDKDGDRLLKKFSIPRDPTKTDPRTRIHLHEDPADAELLYKYNLRDIEAEAELSSKTPDLNEFEQKFWSCDLHINTRGVRMDVDSIKNCISIIDQAHQKYNAELCALTGGIVNRASECAKIIAWVNTVTAYVGPKLMTLDSETVEGLLAEELPDNVRRVLQIRQLIGSAAVKKLYTMSNQMTNDNRLHDLFIYHSARTGRAAGSGPQPQNLPNSGPAVDQCVSCDQYYTRSSAKTHVCPWCGMEQSGDVEEWNINAVENALEVINTGSLECVEMFFGDAVNTVSGCLRSLFIAAPGHDLICSDYSAIEAVVLAELAGEAWRQEVFRTHGKIYEMSASKITGVPFEEFEKYKAETGNHHPLRKKIGKTAELASGYQGWVGAWKAFGADAFFSEDEMKEAILAWRTASPAIVKFWGGQTRRGYTEYYGVEGMVISAVLNPNTPYTCQGIEFLMTDDILYIKLLSGRYLTYHKPRVTPATMRAGLSISYEGWNSNAKYGAPGWQRMDTYGGRLVENIVQATARDILAYAIVNLEEAGYPVVLHVHDEIVCEMPEGQRSIEEFEKIMSTMPEWAKGWPVKASGGWRGKRYRK